MSFIADGNINPARFVMLVGASADGRILEATAGARMFGISGKTTRRSDYISNDGYHAAAGEPCLVYREGEECALELGGTVSRGNLLKATTNGKGIAITTDKDVAGATALAAGVSGEIVPVRVTLIDAAV